MPATPVYLCGTVGSVLDLAHAFAAESCLPVWGSILAGCQRSGRGQLRREWISPPGNIYAALRLPLVEPFASGAASLAVGALLVEVFEPQGIRLLLKWPNDLLLELPPSTSVPQEFMFGKAGGILLEERAGVLIAGIGINVASAPFHECIREGGLPATFLNCLPNVSILVMEELLDLWYSLVDSFIVCYRQWGRIGNNDWLASVEQRLVWKGEPVLLDDGAFHRGILLGLSDLGGVRLLCDGVEKEFLSGNLSSVHHRIFFNECLRYENF